MRRKGRKEKEKKKKTIKIKQVIEK